MRLKRPPGTTIAFVSSVAENVGEMGRYVHFGMTSSDVLDTAMSLLVREAGSELLSAIDLLQKALEEKIDQTKDIICAGRTHGIHAEPTTFGFKMAGFWAELKRNRERVVTSLEQMAVCKISGAVGTYSSQPETVEAGVAKRLHLNVETLATQVVPRDRHAELFCSLSILGSGLERLAVELRHLQRTEVGEVTEGFAAGQKGSSAMPHKKNPISAENISGCARLLRGYASAAQENVALWHERDISHSSVERVIFPDAFCLVDYMVDRMTRLISGLEVNALRMQQNLDLSQGHLFSSHVLLALVQTGMSREEAYAHVQRVSHGLKVNETLRDALGSDLQLHTILSDALLGDIFSGKKHLESISRHLAHLGFSSSKKTVQKER
jgi:adenylosuccinate lyase